MPVLCNRSYKGIRALLLTREIPCCRIKTRKYGTCAPVKRGGVAGLLISSTENLVPMHEKGLSYVVTGPLWCAMWIKRSRISRNLRKLCP
jgi:hypothetical protein